MGDQGSTEQLTRRRLMAEPTEKQEMTFEYCPSCAGELDTGFECNKCGRDWRPWATVYFDVTDTEGVS